MLRFIFGKKNNSATVKTETQRESFERVMAELNGLLADQPIKPSITVDMATGQLVLGLPEQLADEALALPAPTEDEGAEVEDVAEATEDTAETTEEEAPK